MLVVDVDMRTLIHHHRSAAGDMTVRLSGGAPITLGPPGLVLDRTFEPA